MKRSRFRIGTKLIVSSLLITVLLMSILALATNHIISARMKEDAQEAISHNLKAAWIQFYARGYQMKYGMAQASMEVGIKKALKDREKAFFQRQMAAWKIYRPYVDLWTVVDQQGKVIARLNNNISGDALSFEGLIEEAMGKKEAIISTELISKEMVLKENLQVVEGTLGEGDLEAPLERGVSLGEGMMLIVITPVLGDDGNTLGAIITGDLLNNDSFVPDTLAEKIPGSLVTIAQKGINISTNVKRKDGRRAIGRLLPPEVIAEINKGHSYKGKIEVTTGEYLSAFDPIIDYKGRVIGALFVGVPKEKFIELQHKNVFVIGTITFIGLLIAFVATYTITQKIIRPIKELTAETIKVAEVHKATSEELGLALSMNVPGDIRDEVYQLTYAFHQMMESIKASKIKLRTWNEKLQQQRSFIETLINSLPLSLHVVDRQFNIVAWNKAREAGPLRFKEEEIIGRNFLELVDLEAREVLETDFKEVFQTGLILQTEQESHFDGEKRVFRVTKVPIYENKEITYVACLGEDITEQKQMELQMITSEKLAAAGQLAAGIAHEVNNPLGGILNCLYNLKNKNLIPERRKEYILSMEDGIRRVQKIVKQLLEFSQQHEVEFSLVDINTLIDRTVSLIRYSLLDRDEISIETDLDKGLPEVIIDSHKMEQVLINLILNAVQAIDDRGVVKIKTSFYNGWCRIEVSDTGCGISPEILPKIFDPFFTTKGVDKGTGLGLSVSRGIIERHRGKIEVKSKVGKGTTFIVRLPLGP